MAYGLSRAEEAESRLSSQESSKAALGTEPLWSLLSLQQSCSHEVALYSHSITISNRKPPPRKPPVLPALELTREFGTDHVSRMHTPLPQPGSPHLQSDWNPGRPLQLQDNHSTPQLCVLSEWMNIPKPKTKPF